MKVSPTVPLILDKWFIEELEQRLLSLPGAEVTPLTGMAEKEVFAEASDCLCSSSSNNLTL